jgi:hypothetical protein
MYLCFDFQNIAHSNRHTSVQLLSNLSRSANLEKTNRHTPIMQKWIPKRQAAICSVPHEPVTYHQQTPAIYVQSTQSSRSWKIIRQRT